MISMVTGAVELIFSPAHRPPGYKRGERKPVSQTPLAKTHIFG